MNQKIKLLLYRVSNLIISVEEWDEYAPKTSFLGFILYFLLKNKYNFYTIFIR